MPDCFPNCIQAIQKLLLPLVGWKGREMKCNLDLKRGQEDAGADPLSPSALEVAQISDGH